MTNIGTIKRGDTFARLLLLTDEEQQPLIILLEDMQSQVRDVNGNLVDDVDIATTLTPGQYEVRVDDTTSWPLGSLFMDVKFNYGDIRTSVPTMELTVERDVTLWTI